MPNDFLGADEVVEGRDHGSYVALPYRELSAWTEGHGLCQDDAVVKSELGL